MKIFHFLINVKEKKWDLDRSALKNQRKAKKCNHCALDPKYTPINTNLTFKRSYGTPNN